MLKNGDRTDPAIIVRAWAIKEALIYKKNNDPNYADIIIDDERLDKLPNNGTAYDIQGV